MLLNRKYQKHGKHSTSGGNKSEKGKDVKAFLNCAMNIGEQMLLSGAEVHRVEDSLCRIMAALGARRTDVFIITSSMIVTVEAENGEIYTQTRRITASGTDFERLDRLNALSRKICSEKIPLAEIEAELKQICRTKQYPFWAEVASYAVIAGAFTLFFGGTWIESSFSLLIGAAVRFLILLSDKTVKNKIFTKFIASFASTAVAYILLKLGLIPDVDEVIIGNIMTLIPGIGITNGLRDLFTGDSIAGILRTVESILTALAIAAGYFVLGFSVGCVGEAESVPVIIPWLQVIMGTVGTVGFAVLFNIRNKKLVMVATGGFLSWAIYLLIEYFTHNEVFGYFISAVIISVFSEIMARVLKSPTTTFIIPSLVPLVPGGSLYKTMRYALSGTASLFTQTSIYTLKLSAALALGIILSSAIFKPIIRLINRKTAQKAHLKAENK